MKNVLALLVVLAATTVAVAENPTVDQKSSPSRDICSLNHTAFTWDFSSDGQNFTTASCDEQGMSVWAWGTDASFGTGWITIIDADYPSDAGEALVAPAFTVDLTAGIKLVQVEYAIVAEGGWDGGNLKVNGVPVAPIAGYPVTLNTSLNSYSWCVDNEGGFSGDSEGTVTDCFDLSAFDGESVTLTFEFGSNEANTLPGWAIYNIVVGSDETLSATENETWSSLKSLFE